MHARTILYVINTDTPDKDITEAAQAVAADGNHLMCLLIGTAPALPVLAYGIPPYGGMNIPDNWGQQLNDVRGAQAKRVNAIEGLLAKTDVSADIQPVISATIDIKQHVARAARVSDEAFLAANLRDTPDVLRETVAGALFHSPIAFRLNGAPTNAAKRVFVAWDSSPAAARAVHAALPYLRDADEVLIACIDPVMNVDSDGQDPGTDVAAWLSRRGCSVTVSQFPSGGHEIADSLHSHAKEFGADLVVMGAYGHARMIQTVLGGTTRSMIEQSALPVLMAH